MTFVHSSCVFDECDKLIAVLLYIYNIFDMFAIDGQSYCTFKLLFLN